MTAPAMHTHAWRIPDGDIRLDRHCREIALSTSNQMAVQVTHLPSGKSLIEAGSLNVVANYYEARQKLEAWVLDGVRP